MATTSRKQDLAFAEELGASGFLEKAIDWIKQNMNPDDVFSSDVLDTWARTNGWVLQEDDDD